MNTEIQQNTRTRLILNVVHVLAWVVFIGLCIKTGAILWSFSVSLFMNPEGAKNLYMGLDLSGLHRYNEVHYFIMMSVIIFLSALKAYIFYLVIKIFLKINLVHPFSREIAAFISAIGYVALAIGLFTLIAGSYTDYLVEKGVAFPDMQPYLGGGSEFLLFAGVIFFIAQVFQRGIELQSEHELTV